jgi:CxxC motif-containing protein (DUF1111 family)
MLPIRTGRCASCLLLGTMIVALGVSTWAGSAKAQTVAAPSAKVAPVASNPFADDNSASTVPAPRATVAPLQIAELPLESPDVPPLAQIQRGQEMFMREWKVGDSHTPTGDGLGPMFNAKSCADCHNLGKIGGGGENKHNVDLLSVILPPHKEKIDRNKFRERMTQFHPAFAEGTSFVRPFVTLHKFGNSPDYNEWRTKLLALVAPDEANQEAQPTKQFSSRPNRSAASHSGSANRSQPIAVSRGAGAPMPIRFEHTQRNTPALFGAGLIDSIPEEVIRQAASDQAKHHTGVKGQVALSGTGNVGRFGWRGQTASLGEFVMGACANEIGLQVPGQEQPIDPLDPTHKSPGLDLTQEQCNDLTAFVGSFPPPTQRAPASAKEAERVLAGAHLFNTTGCAVCHMERLGKVTGIYSDLLLHDMGPALADHVPANSNVASTENALNTVRSFGGGYNGGGGPSGADAFVDAPPESLRQWRTPPLWGVADSAPYLHDGRAATLQDAILAHGGEAISARKSFVALPAPERGKILAFLNSLTAP